MPEKSQTVPSKCLHCAAALDAAIVCTGCQTLYPLPEQMDYFTLFQLPHRYRIDTDALERRFLAISRSIHPDYFGDRSDEMRDLSVRLAAELNEAMRVLKDPVLRAGYLLEESGGPSAADNRTVPQSVLVQAMMHREEMEDAGDDQVALAAIRDEVAKQRTEALDQIADIADNLESATDEQKTELRELLNSVKYYDNLLAELPLA